MATIRLPKAERETQERIARGELPFAKPRTREEIQRNELVARMRRDPNLFRSFFE